MKAVIQLLETERSKELINEITEKKFENLEIKTSEKLFEINISGKFYVQSASNRIWIEDYDYVYLIFNSSDIKRFVVIQND